MSAGGKDRLTLVLAALTVLALALSVPGSLRDAWERGGFYLFSREFLLDLPKRLFGPGRFRFLLQPAVAVALGIAAGRADARAGRAPYLYALLLGTEDRAFSRAQRLAGPGEHTARRDPARLRGPVADPGRLVPGRGPARRPGAHRDSLRRGARSRQPHQRGARAAEHPLAYSGSCWGLCGRPMPLRVVEWWR